MVTEFEKLVKEFEEKLKPVTPEMMKVAGVEPGEIPGAVAIEEAPPPEKPGACIRKEFKSVIGVMPIDYIGLDGQDIKDLVVAFLDSLPECKKE